MSIPGTVQSERNESSSISDQPNPAISQSRHRRVASARSSSGRGGLIVNSDSIATYPPTDVGYSPPHMRSKLRNSGGVVTLVLVLLAVACSKSTPAPNPTTVAPRRPTVTSSSTGTAASACTPVKTVPHYDPESQDHFHIGYTPAMTPPPSSTYPSVPPASGPPQPVQLHAAVHGD